jgi:hypothetical protein
MEFFSKAIIFFKKKFKEKKLGRGLGENKAPPKKKKLGRGPGENKVAKEN